MLKPTPTARLSPVLAVFAGCALVLLGAPSASANEIPRCIPGTAKLRPIVEKRAGKKVIEGTLRGSARDGRWIFYWPTGHKKEQSIYCNGSRHGAATFWYDDGLPQLEGAFNRGAPWGSWTFRTREGARRTFRPLPKTRRNGFFYDEGNRALARGELSLAESLLQIALRSTQNTAPVHRSMGVLYAKRRLPPKAAFHYRKYIELNPQAKDRAQVEQILAAYARPAPVKAPPPTPTPVSATPVPTPAPAPAPAIARTVRLEIVTLPAASVVIDGTRHAYLTPLDGPRALQLTPGKHVIILEVQTEPQTVQHVEVTLDIDDPQNRIEFVPGERLTTYGQVKIRPLVP